MKLAFNTDFELMKVGWIRYYMSKKYLPILFSNSLYQMGNYFLDI